MQLPQEILKQYFGFDSFREPQLEIIQSVLAGKDTLALLPTGGGKSLCFQIPALLQDGICIVISPLIALMKDQVFQLKNRNIKAAAIFSGLSFHEIDLILDNCQFGYYKILYVSPERLKTELFIERFKRMKVNLIAVDEAHCISQWGFDFRPSYLEIAEIRKYHPNIPVLALTATATINVKKDIIEKLEFKKGNQLFKKSFQRENLGFVARKEDAKYPKLLEIVQKIKGSGIVYVKSRNKTKDVAEYLIKHNIKADFYHAGLRPDERNRKQDNWIKNKVDIIVCTNAFGMGIDKADVSLVVHLDIPESIESYYQEAGRAGRDGRHAYAVLLYNQSDIDNLLEKNEQKFPPVETIKKVYNAICNHLSIAVEGGKMHTHDFDLVHFCKLFKLDITVVYNSLKVLEQENYLQLGDGVLLTSRVIFNVDKLELYRFEIANSNYALLIKSLLRSYGGIVDHYTPVNEKLLAKHLKVSEAELINQLKLLHKNKILTYIPTSENPTLMLLTERMHEENLYINMQYINKRKKVILDQLNSIIQYAEQHSECRQQIICHYFGEEEVVNCGKCDVCLEKKITSLGNLQFQKARKDILEKVQFNWVSTDTVLPENAHFVKQIYKEVIRFLLDEKVLMMNDKNELKRV